MDNILEKPGFFVPIVLGLCAYLFFIHLGGMALTDPDETFYAQSAKEMLARNEWITPQLYGKPQFEKPILTYWLLRIGFIIFGVSSFSARFFPALFGLIGVIAAYLFAKLLFEDHKKAFISALVLLSAGFYIGMARTVFTVMMFLDCAY